MNVPFSRACGGTPLAAPWIACLTVILVPAAHAAGDGSPPLDLRGPGRATPWERLELCGGPGGDFDWHLPTGTTFVLFTDTAVIMGGPGGAPTATQTVIGGTVELRNLVIEPGARLIVSGPNPCTILASGSVLIEGSVSVDGVDSAGVATLNTTNIPEPGASGNAGGGSGGTGSPLTSQSSPRGGTGFGAFMLPRAGGQGGETSYHPTSKDDRRGAGGGGGRFGPDVFIAYEGHDLRAQGLIGLDAEAGFAGGPNGTGAVSRTRRAQGGAIGPAPFADRDDQNDFFGFMRVGNGLLRGELSTPWAGAGGGGGGDAVRSDSFPLTPFSSTGDEKGAGAGGGAGALVVIAGKQIVVTESGTISADGGQGGGGENTSFFDRVGGGSGGGSGGHIVLQSPVFVQIDGIAPGAGDSYLDGDGVHAPRPISARGGEGGAGNQNRGGANEGGEALWRCDAIPLDVFEGTDMPPRETTCFTSLPDIGDREGPVVGAGGDGSPGLIQIHVPNVATDLRLRGLKDGDLTRVFAPPPVGWRDGAFEGALLLLPTLCTHPASAAPDPDSARRVNPLSTERLGELHGPSDF